MRNSSQEAVPYLCTVSSGMSEPIDRNTRTVFPEFAAYDEAAQDLRNLLEKRDAIRKDELYHKLVNSKWTFEQVIKLIDSDPPDDD